MFRRPGRGLELRSSPAPAPSDGVPMSSFTVRPFEPGDEQGVLELFNRVFAEGNPGFVPRTMETWRRLYVWNGRRFDRVPEGN